VTRAARDLGRRRTARAHRVLDMYEIDDRAVLDLRNASDKELDRAIDGMAAVSREDADPISLDAALDALEALAAKLGKEGAAHANRTLHGQPAGAATKESAPAGLSAPALYEAGRGRIPLLRL
jgi:hypothetical protein